MRAHFHILYRMIKKEKKVWTYVISALIPLVVGGLAGLLTMDSMKEFEQLAKPPLSPPGMLFPIAWSILYILMGIGAARVYLGDDPSRQEALFVYALQLFVNFFWTILFFGFEMRLFAFFWLLLLLALAIFMTVQFKKTAKWAAYLQIPYLVWLVFAAHLNLGVYLLNR